MTNGNGDFPYWESDRTQPGGTAESNIRPEQIEALQSYLNQRSPQPQQHNFVPSPYQSHVEIPRQPQGDSIEYPTITITAGKVAIAITITPL